MIELRTLGALVLKGPEGADLQPILAQPKRLALLVYLALSRFLKTGKNLTARTYRFAE